MKASKKIRTTLLTGLLAFCIATLYYSCRKENNESGSATTSANHDRVVNNAQSIADKISHIKIVANNGKVLSVNTQSGGFSFADPHDGFSFSSSNGIEYVTNPDGSQSIYISAGAFGSNGGGGGGLIVAGNTSMEINFTLCISAADSAEGGFSFGPAMSGVSMVFGISGDLNRILNADESDTTEIGDILNGMAAYMVFDDEASGNYEIVSWLEDLGEAEENPDAFDGKGLAFVIDFRNMSMAFSKEGDLNVSGGSIGFSGKYYQFTPEEGAEDPFDLGEDPEVNVVDGMGTMGCN